MQKDFQFLLYFLKIKREISEIIDISIISKLKKKSLLKNKRKEKRDSIHVICCYCNAIYVALKVTVIIFQTKLKKTILVIKR